MLLLEKLQFCLEAIAVAHFQERDFIRGRGSAPRREANAGKARRLKIKFLTSRHAPTDLLPRASREQGATQFVSILEDQDIGRRRSRGMGGGERDGLEALKGQLEIGSEAGREMRGAVF